MSEVKVWVGVRHAIVVMVMRMDKIRCEQQLVILEQVGRGIVRHYRALLEDVGIVCDIWHGVEVVGSGDDGSFKY